MLNKIIIPMFIFLVACSSARLPQTTAQYAKTSATITNASKSSGGSGVILSSTPTRSLILTNDHICNLIQVGGLVHTDQGDYPVHSFRAYKQHDLCLISVLADLHENTKLAEQPPKSYTDVTAAGHPALLPTMITRGHFADHMTIELMVDVKPCDGSEQGQEGFMCMMTGQKPVMRTFEAQPITATIMPGSSGSGVFNEKGEIAGLVFAGKEGLSYGFIVPYEYVRDFLVHWQQYPEQFPDANRPPSNFLKSFFAIKTLCTANPLNCKGMYLPGLYYAN